MATYQSLQDVPKYEAPRRLLNGTNVGGRFLYQNRYYDEGSFKQQFPGQFSDWQKSQGSIPPGSANSPYPSALPANTFEALLGQAQEEIKKANAANERRYKQLLANTGKRVNMVDQTFAGMETKIQSDAMKNAEALTGAKNDLTAGYDAARSDIEQVGNRALEEINRNQQSANAQTDADLRMRGLYSSTVVDSQRRRNSEVAGRQRADTYESIAGLRSGLSERRGQALSTFGLNAAQSMQGDRLRSLTNDQNRFAAMYQALSDRAGVIERRQDLAPNAAQLAEIVANRESAKRSASAAKTAGIFSGIGSIVGGLSGLFCDRRLKKNIEAIGTTSYKGHQINIYGFQYTAEAISKGLGRAGDFIGPMADEVQMVAPTAVDKLPSGFLYVTDLELQPKILAGA